VISVENRKIFPLRVFRVPANGVPLGIGYRRTESEKKTWAKSLNIGLAV